MAAGLALSTAEEEELEVSAAEATEFTLALVIPEQPEAINADINSVDVRARVNPRGRGVGRGWVEM
jgi:hypothetical protein